MSKSKRSKAWAFIKKLEKQHATSAEITAALQQRNRQKKVVAKKQKSKKSATSVQCKNIPYARYLKSHWWKKKRLQKLDSVSHICNRCGERAWQVHHLHYRSLWKEKNTDLEALCGDCHEREHEAEIRAKEHLRSISRQS